MRSDPQTITAPSTSSPSSARRALRPTKLPGTAVRGAGLERARRPAPARGRRPDRRGELAQLLGAYIERDGRSLNRIAHAALIDVAYLWRLQDGERRHPSRDLLIRLGLALRLEPEEVDELLVAADYAPITLRPA